MSQCDAHPPPADRQKSPRLIDGNKPLPQRRIDGLYRARVVSAALGIVKERGLDGLVLEEVRDRAKVSQTAFYEVVGGREALRVEVLEAIVQLIAGAMTDGAKEPAREGWAGTVRAATETLFAFAEDEPRLAVALVVEALGGGEDVLCYRGKVVEVLVAVLESARGDPNDPSAPLSLTGEVLIGGMLSALHTRLVFTPQSGWGQRLNGMIGPLVALAVEPYMGRAAALEELQRPVGCVARPWRAAGEDPLAGLDVRITYRTIRVLRAIGELPGSSSREVAEGAGVRTAAQISALLARLAGAGLIENTGEEKPGRAKAWRLTEKGEAVEKALRGLG